MGNDRQSLESFSNVLSNISDKNLELTFDEQGINFDFEDIISKDEAEKKRLVESQFLVSSNKSECSYKRQFKGNKNIVCRHWIRGMCCKGFFCDFLHQYEPDKMPVCRNYQKRKFCPEHEQGLCIFTHEDKVTVNEHLPNEICLHYFLGFCREGPRCRKIHLKKSMEEIPDLVPDWYLHLVLMNAKSFIPERNHPEVEIILSEIERKCLELHIKRNTDASKKSSKSNFLSSASNSLRKDENDSLKDFSNFNSKNNSFKCKITRDSSGKTLSMLPDMNYICKLAEDKGIPRLPVLCYGDRKAHKIRNFMIKSREISNIHTSIRLGVWATTKTNTETLENAFDNCDHVILLFSGNETGGFQGYARMASKVIPDLYPDLWGSFSSRLGGNFRIQWLKQCSVDFEHLKSIYNPLNGNQPIRKSRDCQEVPLSLAEIICTVLDQDPDKDLLEGTPLATQSRIDHSTFFLLTEEERVALEINLGLREKPLILPNSRSRNDMKRNHHPPPPPIVPKHILPFSTILENYSRHSYSPSVNSRLPLNDCILDPSNSKLITQRSSPYPMLNFHNPSFPQSIPHRDIDKDYSYKNNIHF